MSSSQIGTLNAVELGTARLVRKHPEVKIQTAVRIGHMTTLHTGNTDYDFSSSTCMKRNKI